MRDKILGAWTLESFEIEDAQGQRQPWGRELSGLLIYDSSGRMSVGFNRAPDATTANEYQRIFDATLFCSGRFEVEGDVVVHFVQNASNPERIGRTLKRIVHFEGERMHFRSQEAGYGRAYLRWRRA